MDSRVVPDKGLNFLNLNMCVEGGIKNPKESNGRQEELPRV